MAPSPAQYLKEQLGFIKTSCDAYDAGSVAEAIRIGTALRVLIHQTNASTSLLTHMNATSISLLSTTRGWPHAVMPLAFDGMSLISTATGLTPKLGSGGFHANLVVDEWWNQVVFVINGVKVTRRDLALAAANKAGGAHVDLTLPPAFGALMDGMWSDNHGKIPDQHAVCLRQMGYEALSSPDLTALAAP